MVAGNSSVASPALFSLASHFPVGSSQGKFRESRLVQVLACNRHAWACTPAHDCRPRTKHRRALSTEESCCRSNMTLLTSSKLSFRQDISTFQAVVQAGTSGNWFGLAAFLTLP